MGGFGVADGNEEMIYQNLKIEKKYLKNYCTLMRTWWASERKTVGQTKVQKNHLKNKEIK